MKNPSSLPNSKFVLFPIGLCMVLAAGFLVVRGFPRSLWPTLIVAGISCVLIAGLLLLISAEKDVRDALGYISRTDMGSKQGDRAVSSKVEKFQPLGISGDVVAMIQPAHDAHKESLGTGDVDEEDRAA